MPRDGSTILSDLKTERLDVACTKCERQGSYSVQALISRLGPDFRLTDLLSDLTRDCPRRTAPGGIDACGARYPQLAGGAQSS